MSLLGVRRTATALMLDVAVVLLFTLLVDEIAHAVHVGSEIGRAGRAGVLGFSFVWLEYNWASIARAGRTVGYLSVSAWVRFSHGRGWRSGGRASLGPVSSWLYLLAGGSNTGALVLLLAVVVIDRGAEAVVSKSLGDLLFGGTLSKEPVDITHHSWHVGRWLVVATLLGVSLGVGEVLSGHRLLPMIAAHQQPYSKP